MFDLIVAGDAVRERVGGVLRLDDARERERRWKRNAAAKSRAAAGGWRWSTRRPERREPAAEGVAR